MIIEHLVFTPIGILFTCSMALFYFEFEQKWKTPQGQFQNHK